MPAHYKLDRMPDPLKSGEVRPLHPRFKPAGTISIKDLGEAVNTKSSFSTADLKGMLQLIQDLIVESIELGYDFKLDGIGSFYPALKGKVVMDKKDIRSESIELKSVNFRPAKELKQRLRKIKFYRAKDSGMEKFDIEEREKRMISYLDLNKFITCSVYAAINNCSKSKAVEDLKLFCSEKKIIKEGKGPSTFYHKQW